MTCADAGETSWEATMGQMEWNGDDEEDDGEDDGEDDDEDDGEEEEEGGS